MTSAAVRRVWTIGGSLFAVPLLIISTAQIAGTLARGRTAEVTTFAAAEIRLLDVRNRSGSVEVVGREVAEVTVSADMSHGFQRSRHRASVEDGVLTVRTSCPIFSADCSVRYRIVVPASMAVTARAHNGRLTVADVTGNVRVGGDNGAIELARLSGALHASTNNGRVRGTSLSSEDVTAESDNGDVELELAQPPRRVSASTHNGTVDVVLPETSHTYRVDLATHNGRTETAVRTDPASARSIVGRSDNGSLSVRYPTG